MKSIKLFDRRVVFVVVAFALLLATIVPAIVSAAQLTGRSIALSSSSVAAEDVSYTATFTTTASAAAFVIDFCSDSPVIGQECTEPTDFTVAGATSSTVGYTDVDVLDVNTLMVTGAVALPAATEVAVTIDGIDNPSVSGPLYARIVTYDLATNADDYDSEDLGTGSLDQGGAAVYINNTIGVAGAVLESITFCVSGEAIDKDCDVTGNLPPTIKLGETVVGDVVALSAGTVSEESIFTQLSTNAVSGAVVSLKSSALGCGGLMRAGAPTACDILPALDTGIDAGEAKFGVRTGTVTNSVGATDPVGTLRAVPTSDYNASTFTLNYIEDDETGVTSTFGDLFLDTAGLPANNKNMEITFGASISNSTPAGLYSVDIGLIATGKY